MTRGERSFAPRKAMRIGGKDEFQKPPSPYDANNNIIELTCPRCGKHSRDILKDFYASPSPLFIYANAIPVCKKCVNEVYHLYIQKYNDEKFALKMLCANFDIFYDDNEAGDVLSFAPNRRVSEYFRRIENEHGRTKTFGDTLLQESRYANYINSEGDLEGHAGVKKKTVRMFGYGYEDEDYIFLQAEYDDWTHRYEVKEKSLEETIKNICIMQLNIRKAQQSGADATKLIKSMNDSIAMANLKPASTSEEKKAYSYGELIAMHEWDKPIPTDKRFEDVDHIGKYVSTWFFGQLTRVFGKRNQFSDMYDEEIAKYTVKPPASDLEDDEEDGDA